MIRISQVVLVAVVAVVSAVVGGITVSSRGSLAPAPQSADVAAAMMPSAPALRMSQPVVYTAPGISRVTPEELASARPVSRTTRTAVRERPKSSWQKRALVIGGSAGAGAGIGAMAGGKKGALIGAAIGGGGAAIIDVFRHR